MAFFTKNRRYNPGRVSGIYYLKIILSLIFLLSIMSCGFMEPPEKNAVIIIGDTSLSMDELREDIERITFEMGITDQDVKQGMTSILDKVVEKKLILEYGKSSGISVSDEEFENAVREIKSEYPEDVFNEMLLKQYLDIEEWKKGLKEDLLIKKITDHVVSEGSAATYDEAKEYYSAHQEEFRHPRMINLRQILTETREEIDRVQELIKEGHDMRELASEYSIAPESKDNGLLGWISRGDLDKEMDDFIFSLKEGEKSKVLESPYGFHIFEVLEIKEEGIREFPDTIKEIEVKISSEKKESIYKKWLDNLKSRYPVSIKENQIIAEWGMEG